ncbi:hypothetical protein FGO68_gene6858 [Halteria grandinella]|uniref:Uncharacterized protein n=1 Tax=Halteria grandinella TaxID=5974 RepID=A0A8J8NB90_HALGN|nr:hypothetical protein FGO68_gene6858 [Halteria grandinella]
MTLSLQQQEKYQFTLETALINNLQTPIISQCTPIQKGNELVISQDIKLTVDDVTVNGPAVIAKINGQYFTKQQPLSGVAINYEINYQDKASGLSKYTFPGISNDQGVSKLFVIYPKGPAVLKFSAFKENFWIYHQTKDDEKFTLIVSQEYKLNYAITLEEGQFNQKVLGIIVNKNTLKPLAEVKVVVTFSSESQGYQVKQCSLLQKLNSVTDSNGKFEINYQTKLWKKFIIQIEFLKEFYAHNEMTKSIVMDHDDRSKIADTWDLGIIKLPVQPQVNLDGYVIDAYKKPVDNLKISMTAVCLDIKTNFETTTDKDGHWEVLKLQLEPSNNYELTMKYKLQNGEEISNLFKFTTTEEPQQKITLNPLYYETLIQPEISGSFNLEKDMLPLKVPFIINCLKDKQLPDIIKGITDFSQKFDMKWQITRRFDQTLSCSITNENLDITQPFAQNVILKPIDWKADEKISVKYNTLKQIMSGTVKDQTKIAKFIGNAQINLKIYQKDANLHTQSVTKELSSNEKDGTFTFSFLLAKGEKSFIKITASHPDFQDYIKADIAFNADKDYTVNSDLEMKRVESNVILHYKVNTLQQPATISLKASEPMMQIESLYSPKTYSSNEYLFLIKLVGPLKQVLLAIKIQIIKLNLNYILPRTTLKCMTLIHSNVSHQLKKNLKQKSHQNPYLFQGNSRLNSQMSTTNPHKALMGNFQQNLYLKK